MAHSLPYIIQNLDKLSFLVGDSYLVSLVYFFPVILSIAVCLNFHSFRKVLIYLQVHSILWFSPSKDPLNFSSELVISFSEMPVGILIPISLNL